TIPGALLDGDLVAEGANQVVALCGREPAELDVGALGPDRERLRGLVPDEQGPIAVEIGLARVPVVGVSAADPVGTLDVLDEDERTRPHDVSLVPVDVALEDVGLVDPVPG